MNIVDFYFNGNELHLIFDNEFKHIKFEKYEKSETNNNISNNKNIIGLEHDYTELTFTKKKKSIIIFTSKCSDIVIINIKEIDNEIYCYSNLFIKCRDTEDTGIQETAMIKGLTQLLSGNFMKNDTVTNTNVNSNTNQKKMIIQLKNENISADFIRK
jgi:hypothetical protein